MTTQLVHGASVSSSSLAIIYNSAGFTTYINSTRDNSDGTHAEIVARNPLNSICYSDIFDRIAGIGSLADFLANGGKLKPAPSQTI